MLKRAVGKDRSMVNQSSLRPQWEWSMQKMGIVRLRHTPGRRAVATSIAKSTGFTRTADGSGVR